MCLPANSMAPAGFYRWWCRYRLLLCVCDEVIMWQITQSLHHYISNKFDQSWPLKADAAVGVSKLPVDCFSVPWYLKLMVKNSNYSFIFLDWAKITSEAEVWQYGVLLLLSTNQALKPTMSSGQFMVSADAWLHVQVHEGPCDRHLVICLNSSRSGWALWS